MAKIHPIQRRFSAGVLSPRLHAQSDVDGYSAGLSECLNYVPLKHGMLTRRGGFRHVANVGGTLAKALPFQLTPDSKIGESFIAVVSNDGTVKVVGANGYSAGKELVINTEFSGGLAPWESTLIGSATNTWSAGKVRMYGGKTPSNRAILSQQLSIPTGEENEDLRMVIEFTKPSGFENPTSTYSIGTTKNGGELISDATLVTGREYTINPNGNASLWLTIKVNGSTPYQEAPGDPESNQVFYRDLISVSVSSLISGSVEFPHAYTDTQISSLKSWPHPTDSEIWILTGSSEPFKLKYDPVANVWSYDPVGIAGLPSEWVGTNWPSTLTFFQGRSWWGGLPDNPVSFWGSKSGLYNNLTVGSAENDGVQIDISRQGKIQWMEGVRNLLVGTSTGEYIVTSEGGVIFGGDFKIEPQSANGGSSVASIPIGTSAFYVSSDSRKVYSATYQWTEQAWNTRDITFIAEHLTDSANITDMTYAKNPENIIWAATSDNKFIGCTYQPESGTVGWHSHDVDGDVLSLATVERSGYSSTYAIIRRIVSGSAFLTLEVMDPNVYMDGAYVETFEEPIDTVTGLTHLAGLEVRATVDGAVLPPLILDETGSGVLKYKGRTVHVGISFTSRIRTLPSDFGSVSGSSMSMAKGWNSISLRILDSAKPVINGVRPPDRTPISLMDTRENLFTGDVKVTAVGMDTQAIITVEEDLPVKSTIVGIFGEMSQSSL